MSPGSLFLQSLASQDSGSISPYILVFGIITCQMLRLCMFGLNCLYVLRQQKCSFFDALVIET